MNELQTTRETTTGKYIARLASLSHCIGIGETTRAARENLFLTNFELDESIGDIGIFYYRCLRRGESQISRIYIAIDDKGDIATDLTEMGAVKNLILPNWPFDVEIKHGPFGWTVEDDVKSVPRRSLHEARDIFLKSPILPIRNRPVLKWCEHSQLWTARYEQIPGHTGVGLSDRIALNSLMKDGEKQLEAKYGVRFSKLGNQVIAKGRRQIGIGYDEIGAVKDLIGRPVFHKKTESGWACSYNEHIWHEGATVWETVEKLDRASAPESNISSELALDLVTARYGEREYLSYIPGIAGCGMLGMGTSREQAIEDWHRKWRKK